MSKKFLNVKNVIAMAMALLIIVGSNYTICAGTSSPTTVSVEKPGYGMVTLDSGTLNVRQSASTSAQIITSLPNESFIMIVGTSGNFYKVQYDKYGHYGYVSRDFVEFWYEEYYLKVTGITGNLNMREIAEPTAEIVGSIPANTSFVHFYDVGSSWYCGLYGNQVGSVSAAYVKKISY